MLSFNSLSCTIGDLITRICEIKLWHKKAFLSCKKLRHQNPHPVCLPETCAQAALQEKKKKRQQHGDASPCLPLTNHIPRGADCNQWQKGCLRPRSQSLWTSTTDATAMQQGGWKTKCAVNQIVPRQNNTKLHSEVQSVNWIGVCVRVAST